MSKSVRFIYNTDFLEYMNKKIIILLSVIVLSVLVIPVYAQESNESDLIPTWVKGIFSYWVDDKINDSEAIEALQFLIDTNIIKIGNTQIVNMSSIDQNTLELEQKNNRISILENESKGFETEKTKLLETIEEHKQKSDALQTSLTKSQSDFKQFKKDYPLKIGNIGGKLVVDYIQELENKIAELEK